MKIKNWSQFQHFKDRRPPWIKLYRDILDDIEWHNLDAQASKVLVMCWLIASENDGRLPDIKTLAFRLRMSEKNTSESIIKLSHWLEHDDINVISQRYQDDSPETETETETKREKKATGVACPDGLDSSLWIDFLTMRKAKKLPMTQTALDGLTKQAEKIGWTLAQVIEECVNRGWGGFKAEWLTQKSNVADIARVTVPGKQERDPALVKLDQDRQITKPPSLEVLARMAELRGRS